MEKKESSKTQESKFKLPFASAGFSFLSGKVLSVLQFLLGLCLLPFVYGTSRAFFQEFGAVEQPFRGFFWAGTVTFLAIHLFIWEPKEVYDIGHGLLESVFNYFKHLVKVAPYLLPVYTIIIFIIYGVFSFFIKSQWLLDYCVYFSGFSTLLHLTFSAKTVASNKDDFLRGNYIFSFSFIFVINLLILSLCLGMAFKEFSFISFAVNAYSYSSGIFAAIFRQLFVV